MSAAELPMAEAVADDKEPGSRVERLERWIERTGERLNPILVKEARQALKSRQFLLTFSLVLLFGWLWSLIGIAQQGAAVRYAAGGGYMLIGYFFILVVPMLVVVPFAAFRSLAAEREDGTFELLCITSLSSRQIVTGKLGSALLQMLVYYSALSPCIAFTYMLRGIDILTIAFVLIWTFLLSTLLAAIALLVATASRSRVWQAMLMVVTISGLLFVTWMWSLATVAGFLTEVLPYDEAEFWYANFATLTAYVSYFVLSLLAAGSALTFASDNRSTKLRVVMLVQQVCLIGWVLYLWLAMHEQEVLYALPFMGGIHWMIMGALMTGELPQLSPRVKRQLPHSVFGRMTLTWFNPGSGTGYLFAVSNLAVIMLVACGAALAGMTQANWNLRNPERFFIFCPMAWAYATIYLGAGRLLILFLRRFLEFGVLVAFVFQAALLALGAALPAILQGLMSEYLTFDYTPMQIPNWAWTLYKTIDGDIWSDDLVPPVVIATALLILFVNVIYATDEIEQTRQAAPERVLADGVPA